MKTQSIPDNKLKTAPLVYKPPLNLTPSLPVTQSYHYYNDPSTTTYSSDYDTQVYSSDQLVSRGASTKPSPPSTGTFHELHGGSSYMRPKDSDVYPSHNMTGKYEAYKDSGPPVFTVGSTMLNSYSKSEVSNIVYL